MSGRGKKKPSRTQKALADKNQLRFANAKQVSALYRLGMDPGWTRDAGEKKDQYVFRKAGVRRRATVFRDKDGDRVSYIRNTIVAYQLDDRRIFWAEKQTGGDYAISKRFNPAMVGADKLNRIPQRSDNGLANGYVPLYAMLGTSTVENKNLKGPNGKPLKYVVNKYKLFNDPRPGNNQGIISRMPGQIQQYTNAEKYNMAKPPPPPICEGKQMNLKDLNPATSCFVQGMQERLKPVLDEIEKGKAAGADACISSKKQMQPHQQGVYELARAMATRKSEEMGGSRGLLAFHNTGSGKCLDPATPLVTYAGDIIRADDLRPGMQLMGMDGTPRTVLDVGRGTEDMYEIRPTKGDAWRCNASHILSLKYNRQGSVVAAKVASKDVFTVYWHQYENGEKGAFRAQTFKTREAAEEWAMQIDKNHIVDIPLDEYLNLPIYMRHFLKLFRAEAVDFEPREQPSIDPYVLGAWLGDGTSTQPEFTLEDPQIVEEIQRRQPDLVMTRRAGAAAHKRAAYYRLQYPDSDPRKGRTNPFKNSLQECGVLKNKHIPTDVKCGSKDVRMQVLAGLLDTDGHLQGNCYEIIQKNQTIANDIVFVARSLGFAAYVQEVTKTCVKPDGSRVPGQYHRVNISGSGLEHIPVVLERKKAAPRQQIKDVLRTGFDVVPVGVGPYVGPALDGDHRYLLGDFTVTHNTLTSLGIVLAFWNTPRRIILATTPANEADNNLTKYAENLLTFFPHRAGEVFKGRRLPDLADKKAVKAWVDDKNNIAPLTNRVKTYTFTTLASELGKKGKGFGRANPLGDKLFMGDKGDGSVLIMDEVQSLFTPDPKFKEATEYLVPKLTDPKIVPKMFVFALTATPGNSVKDIINVLNFVRPAGSPAFVPADAKDPSKFAGLVSYVDIRSDTTRYGTKRVQNIYVPMDGRYYAGFLKSITLTDADLDYAKRVKQSKEFGFLAKQRTAGDFLIKSAVAGLFSDAELKAKAAKRIPEAVSINANQLRILSPKLIQVLTNVMEMPGKQYIWVAELNTAKVVAAALARMGHAQVQPGQFKLQPIPGDPGKKALQPTGPLLSQGKRFIMYKKGTANGEDLNEKVLTGFAGYFNNTNNDDGSLCKIMLATETYYQGLDMRALQGVHLVDSLFNATADKQAVGRALRLCGHSGARVKTVMVHRYFSTPPSAKFNAAALNLKGAAAKKVKDMEPLDRKMRGIPGKNAQGGFLMPEGTNARNVQRYPGVNTYVHISGAQRQQPVTQFELGLKAFAVDCPVFKMTYHRGEPFQCGKVPAMQQIAPAAANKPFVKPASNKPVNKPASNKPAANGGLSWLFGKPKPKPVISAMNNNTRPSAPPLPVFSRQTPSPPPPRRNNSRPSAPPLPSKPKPRYTKAPPRAPAKANTTSAFKFFQMAEQASKKKPSAPLRRKVPARAQPPPRRTKVPARVQPAKATQPPPKRPSTPPRNRNAGLKDAQAAADRLKAQREKNRQKRQQQQRR